MYLKLRYTINSIIFSFSFFSSLFSCHSNSESTIEYSAKKNTTSDSLSSTLNLHSPDFKLDIFKNSDSSYGYSVRQNNKNFIIQKSIPAIMGNKGFDDKRDAERCGLLIIEKLKKNIWPPSISLNEIDSLKIKY